MTLLSVVLVFFGTAPAVAQNTGTVGGEVTDASTGAPIAGVQVQVVGTNLGGLTGENGRYLLTGVPAGEQTIRATYIGYSRGTETVVVPSAGTVTANFQLRTSAIELEGLLVSAITGREQRARELGTASANIQVEDINPTAVTSFADALGGRTEGVVMQDVSGTTGTSQRIRIRGANSLSLSNEPLVYIDGIQANSGFGGTLGVGGQESSRLGDLNPNEIASMEIIKGPAASSLYGTAAANGVILITTKRGRAGSTQWNAWVEGGLLDDVADYPAAYGSIQVADATAEKFVPTGGLNPAYGSFCPNARAGLPVSDPNHCTQDDQISYNTAMDDRTRMFQTGNRTRYGASVRGGNDDVRYFISGQIEDEEGIIHINTQEKANLRVNLDARLRDDLDASISFGYAQNNLALNSNDNSIFSPIINMVVGLPYYIPPVEGDPVKDPVNDSNFGFGYNLAELEELPTFGNVDRYITSANMRWRPMTWLSINATGGLDLTTSHMQETLRAGGLPSFYPPGWRQSERFTNYNYTGQLSGVGTFELTPDLISTTTIGTSYTRENEESTMCYGEDVTPGTQSCGAVSSFLTIDEDFFEIRTVGAYVQQELALSDRLFLAAGVRGDDNSAFGTEFDFAVYPSASASWVVAEEPWFPQMDFLNTLRLRTAWGVSGLRPGFRDAVTLFQPTTVATPAGDVAGVSLSVTGNEVLKPERSTEYEFGFDTGLFEDRLSIEATYFNKTSEDALIERRLPGSIGLTGSFYDNIGSIRNSGTELGVNLRVYESDNFGLNLGMTNTTLSNEIEELGVGVEPIPFNRGLQRHEAGYTAGVFVQNEVLWDDANGDGKLTICQVASQAAQDAGTCINEVTLGDEVYIGPSLPTWQRSFFADVSLFGFMTVSSLIEGRGGHYTGNDTEAFRCGRRSTVGCAAVGDQGASLEDQAAYLADRYLGSAYGFIEKADFYRWRELSVSLTAPQAVTQRFNQFEGLRLTVAGRNLALWTDYPGIDPESVEGGGNANFSQSEFNSQPPVRQLMLRLDYSF
jgi:TonB-linked SusC/RagA family outer membrane protein